MTPGTVTVMTYNVAAGLVQPVRLAAGVRASGADLVGLQEVSAGQAAALPLLLADAFPFTELHGLGIPGKGLLSRLPLVDARLLEIAPGRPDLRATILLTGGPVTVMVVHPEPPRIGRAAVARNARSGEHARALAAEAKAAAAAGPVIVMGDFNRVAWQPIARLFAAAGLRDAWRDAGRGPGFTLPTRWANGGHRGHALGNLGLPALVRVDYVWHSRHFVADAAWLGDAGGSDHRPVIARLRRTD